MEHGSGIALAWESSGEFVDSDVAYTVQGNLDSDVAYMEAMRYRAGLTCLRPMPDKQPLMKVDKLMPQAKAYQAQTPSPQL